MGFCHVGQAGLEVLTSGDPPTLASQNAGITGMSHCVWPVYSIFSLSTYSQQKCTAHLKLQEGRSHVKYHNHNNIKNEDIWTLSQTC